MQSSYFGPGTVISVLHALSPKPLRQPYELYTTIMTIPIQTPKPVSNHCTTLPPYFLCIAVGKTSKLLYSCVIIHCMLVLQGENRHVSRLPFCVLGFGTVTRAWRRHSVNYPQKGGKEEHIPENKSAVSLAKERKEAD